MDYLWKAGGAWFLGFFPMAEIYVAVPSAMAMGLDDLSVLLWTVLGNLTPALLITALYQQMIRIPRIARWFGRLYSEKVQRRINRWGVWFVLVTTPWVGIWAMTIAAKVLGMNTRRFLLTASVSIVLYAMAILVMLRAGVETFS